METNDRETHNKHKKKYSHTTETNIEHRDSLNKLNVCHHCIFQSYANMFNKINPDINYSEEIEFKIMNKIIKVRVLTQIYMYAVIYFIFYFVYL